MPYFEKITRSGRLLEVERYFATRDGRRLARGENRAESSEEMERLNERNARRKLMRLINANFSGAAGDLFVTLTHAQPVDEAQAAKEERNVLLRIARARERRADVVKFDIAQRGNLHIAARSKVAAHVGGNGVFEYQRVRARANRCRARNAKGERGERHLRARLRRHADIAAGKGCAVIADARLHAVLQHLHHHGRPDAYRVTNVQSAREVI